MAELLAGLAALGLRKMSYAFGGPQPDVAHRTRGLANTIGLSMDNKYWDHAPRSPRHQATGTAELRVEVQRSGRQASSPVEAELLDISRSGIRFRVPLALTVEESITVRLHTEDLAVDLTLPCTVQWRRPEDDGVWSIGCESASQVDWETLGELFLCGALDTDLSNDP